MDGDGWIGVSSLFVAGLFAWLNKRDANRHDEELRALRNQNASQAAQIAALAAKHRDCEENHAATRKKLYECEEKHVSVERRVVRLEELVSKAEG